MMRRIAGVAVLIVMAGWGAGLALAQESPSSDSLADLARQTKEQRAKSHEKPKVYTNEDLQALPPLPMVTTGAKPGHKAEHPSMKAGPAKGGEKRGEEYFRDRMGQLEERLELDERELAVFNQKLGEGQTLYYSDSVEGLLQSSGPMALSDVHNLQDRIAAKQAEIDQDQEAIDDLHEELRRAGGDPGWLRNVPPAVPAAQPDGTGGKNWDARFKLARTRLADAEEQLRVSQEELKLLRTQAVQALNSATKAGLDGKVKDKEDEISQKQRLTDDARKALDELQQEFDASGEQEDAVKQ